MKISMITPPPGWYEEYGPKIAIAALFMSLLALILVINRYIKGYRKKGSLQHTEMGLRGLTSAGLTDSMKQEVRLLIKQEMKSGAPVPTSPLTVNENYRDAHEKIPDGKERLSLSMDEGPVTMELLLPKQVIAPAAVPKDQVQRLYAKFPADEHRFSADMLVEVQDGEQVYELEIRGDAGIYRISEQPAVQKYALSEDKYLLACTYDEIPTNRNVRILNAGDGQVTRNGNDWHIDTKAAIKFV